MVVPPPLRPGARLQVVAPSSPFEAAALHRGIAWLEERYQVTCTPDLFERRQGFLAGSDEQRLAELQAAFDAPDTQALVCVRGGYGLTRLLGALDWTEFSRRPRWIVGFSDVTALHCAAVSRGFATLHAPNVTSLADADDEARARWIAALESPESPRAWSALDSWQPGTAEGPLFGGNLTLLFTLAASGQLRVPNGALLVLEDVSEASYRIDRMLTALEAGGYLQMASAIILGDFTDCSPGKYEVPVERVLHERLRRLGVPLVAGFPLGHGVNNHPLPLGRRARLEAPAPGLTARLSLLPP